MLGAKLSLNQRFVPIAFSFVGLIIPSSAFAVDWVFMNQEKGVTTYKMEVPGTDLLAFKGEGDIEAPIERIAAVLFDTKRAPEWVANLEEAKIVRWTSANEFVEYDHINTPPLITRDREFLSHVKMDVDPITRAITFTYQAIEDPHIPETKHVRGDLGKTSFVLTPIEGNTRTHVVGEIHCDPKGSIPKWLVNFFQRDWPVNTLESLRKQVAKQDIKIDQKILSLLMPKRSLADTHSHQ